MQKIFQLLQSISKSHKSIVKLITYDNGSEISYYCKLSKNLGINSYICNPYHSWEKGIVENIISRIRKFIPKGTNITKVSVEYL